MQYLNSNEKKTYKTTLSVDFHSRFEKLIKNTKGENILLSLFIKNP